MLTSGIGEEGPMTLKLQNGGGGEEKSNESDVAERGASDPGALSTSARACAARDNRTAVPGSQTR